MCKPINVQSRIERFQPKRPQSGGQSGEESRIWDVKRGMSGNGGLSTERKGGPGQVRRNAQEGCAIQRMGVDPAGWR